MSRKSDFWYYFRQVECFKASGRKDLIVQQRQQVLKVVSEFAELETFNQLKSERGGIPSKKGVGIVVLVTSKTLPCFRSFGVS
jgi:hypothetical protein